MYLKIIGSLFLMLSATAIGFLKADELKQRVRCLQELKRMMVFLQGELRFHRASLPEAFENVSERVEEPFRQFLKHLAERLETREADGFDVVWSEMSEQLLQKEGFVKEDRQLLEMLQSSLGYLDLKMQTETLNLAVLQVEDAIRLAKEQQTVKGKLDQTMGVTFGALLTLLII